MKSGKTILTLDAGGTNFVFFAIQDFKEVLALDLPGKPQRGRTLAEPLRLLQPFVLGVVVVLAEVVQRLARSTPVSRTRFHYSTF